MQFYFMHICLRNVTHPPTRKKTVFMQKKEINNNRKEKIK